MNPYGWYVIQSHPRKEEFVRDRIADLGRETFFPLITERQRGSRKAKVGPLFPGYLFARLSAGRGDLPRARWTHGVCRLLGGQDGPMPVADTIIDQLRRRADAAGKVTLGAGLRRGDRVKIIDGPFAGWNGVLSNSVKTPEQRVHVLLGLFHRMTRVEVEARAIRFRS